MNRNPPFKKQEPRKPKIPRKITPTYLHNSGLYYLQRFSTSKGNFYDVMARKIRKSCHHHIDQDLDECLAMIQPLIEKFEQIDLLNDQTYARAQITSLRRQGKSKRAIIAKLSQKKVPKNIILTELTQHDTENTTQNEDKELKYAKIFAKKKKIGQFKPKSITKTPETDKKDLAKLARAGFSYEIASKIIKNNDE